MWHLYKSHIKYLEYKKERPEEEEGENISQYYKSERLLLTISNAIS